MVDPVLVGGAAAVAGVAIAAAYAYLSGEDSSAGVDIDNDGEDEVDYTFEGTDSEDEEHRLDGAEPDSQPEDAGSIEDTVSDDVDEQADPTPEAVQDKSGLTDVKGVGSTRAEALGKAGFSTPEDLYYASDENLTDVDGIGSYTVEQIRDDIGSV